MSLCSFCQELDFQTIGYYRAPEHVEDDIAQIDEYIDVEDSGEERIEGEQVLDENEQERDAQSTDHENNIETDIKSDSDETDWRSDEEYGADQRKFLDVLANRGACKLCEQLSSTVEKWAQQYWGGIEKLDLQGAKIRYDMHETIKPKDREWDEDCEARLTIAHITVSIKNPNNPDEENVAYWTGMEIPYQRCRASPSSVAELCDSLEHGEQDGDLIQVWDNVDPYRGRFRPQQADMRLFKAWKDLCASSHQGKCQAVQVFSNHRTQVMRFIDTVDMCLVVRPGDSCRWVALSYVWGRSRFRTLTKNDLEAFLQPGALSAHWVPQTIQDAIVATRGLGERLLWVDSLCIIQDSAEDKATFIPLMDTIYGLATVTIVDMAGDGAFNGLRGIRPNTRNPAEVPVEVGGAWIMPCPPPNGLGYIDPGREIKAKYMTRAWTFQEMVLSQRLLIFTPEVIFWECQQATWREDSQWEVADPERQGVDIFNRSILRGMNLDFSTFWSPKMEDFENSYRGLIEEYSQREMTDEVDGLSAISGILQALGHNTGMAFKWGLPKFFLGVALTWPMLTETRSRRRAAKSRLRVGSSILEVEFPSWSWVGWIGPVQFQEMFGSLDSESGGLAFYEYSEDGSLVQIGQNETVRLTTSQTERHYQQQYPSNPMWRGDTKRKVTSQDIPEGLRIPEIRPILLAFWTSLATIKFKFPIPEHSANLHGDDRLGWQTRDGVVEYCTIAWDQYPELEPGEHSMEFIIVGRETTRVNMLIAYMVDTLMSGARTRLVTARFIEEEWNKLQHRWEIVFMI